MPTPMKSISIKFKPAVYKALKRWSMDEGLGDNLGAFIRSRLLKYLKERGENINKLQENEL